MSTRTHTLGGSVVLRTTSGLVMTLVLGLGCGAQDGDASDGGSATGGEVLSDLDGLPIPAAEEAACQPGQTADDHLCFAACPADVDPVTDVREVACEVEEVSTDASGETTTVVLPPCASEGTPPAGTTACFRARIDDERSDLCVNTGWPLEIEIVRTEPSDACRVDVECQLSQSAMIDCPDADVTPPPANCGDGVCSASEDCDGCAEDCGACGTYSVCDDHADCGDPTPYCLAHSSFDGGAMCSAPCEDFCPGLPDASAACIFGECLVRCEDDANCPAGSTCRDLGPITPSAVNLFCAP